MLATPAEQLPTGEAWLFEVKFDGYRASRRAARRVPAASRATATTSPRASRRSRRRSSRRCERRTPSLDGEVCALDEAGRPSFSAIQAGSGRLVYYAFDVLEADGEPLVDLPLRSARPG